MDCNCLEPMPTKSKAVLCVWKRRLERGGVWTGPWIVVKRLNEVVYRIKFCGTAGRYYGVNRRVVYFNQLKQFHGTNDKGKSCIVAEKEPLWTGMGEGSGVIILEDDVFRGRCCGIIWGSWNCTALFARRNIFCNVSLMTLEYVCHV